MTAIDVSECAPLRWIPDVAQILGVSKRLVKELCRVGILPHHFVGRTVTFTGPDVALARELLARVSFPNPADDPLLFAIGVAIYKSTKHEFVYFIQATGGGPIKIGRAKRPISRLSGIQTGHPYKLGILGCIPGSLEVERAIHDYFPRLRLSGEWFRETKRLRRFIDATLARYGTEIPAAREVMIPGKIEAGT